MEKIGDPISPKVETTEEEIKVPEESKVGKKLSDQTTRRVIILVLSMLFSVPIFSVSTWGTSYDSYTASLESLRDFANSTQFIYVWKGFIDTQTVLDSTPLIYAKADDKTF